MPSEFKPAKRRFFRRGPSKPSLFARFKQEYEAVRVPPGYHGHVIAGPVGFRIIAALFNTLVTEHERQAMMREIRAREAEQREASQRQHR